MHSSSNGPFQSHLLPEFRPHPIFKGGHVQTLAGFYLPAKRFAYAATQHHVKCVDSDTIVLHDDTPTAWTPNAPIVLMVHGLAGCHQSPYMERIAGKLNEAGCRTFRMDMRDCGAGAGLAQNPYHAGRFGDVEAAYRHIHNLCPDARISLAGFSLGAQLVLRLLIEWESTVPSAIDRAVAVNPPIDLSCCVASLRTARLNRSYDRHFVNLLWKQVVARTKRDPNASVGRLTNRPKTLWEFDDKFTAPLAGFSDADEYYAKCSVNSRLDAINVDSLLITAHDDPLVPVSMYQNLAISPSVNLHIAPSGGHLGYVARPGNDPDRRWLDWRVVEWLGHS